MPERRLRLNLKKITFNDLAKEWIGEYGPTKHRYYELKHYCLQYPEWKRMLSKIREKAL